MENRKTERTETEIDLGILAINFIRGLKRMWWFTAVLAALGGSIMYLKSTVFYTPVYKAETTFTVMTGSGKENENSAGYNFYYDSSTAGQLAATFPYILSSSILVDAIREELQSDTINGTISAEAIPDSNMVTMSVTSTDREDAEKILECAVRIYPDVARFVIGETKFNMIDVPTVPGEPYNRPDYTKTVLKGMAGGFAAGLFFIAVWAILRKTVEYSEELKKVSSLNCLASIPAVRKKARSAGKARQIQAVFRNDFSFTESFEGLEIRLDRMMEELPGKKLMITSTAAGEGKSTVARNLTYTLAGKGKRTVLIDADLRKQEDGETLGFEKTRGLEEVIQGKCTLGEALQKHEESGAWFLGGSGRARNVSQILNHPAFMDILSQLEKRMDCIILDAPPAELFDDVEVLSEYVDGILYVVRQDFIQRSRILDGFEAAGRSGKLLGYVFNGVRRRPGAYGYGYGYGYGYKYGYRKSGYEDAKDGK